MSGRGKSAPRFGELQAVLVRKALAPTRRKAASIVRSMGHRTYTSRETKNVWRFRQRPPACFKGTYGTHCIDKGGVKNGVCLIYANLAPDARSRRSCR